MLLSVIFAFLFIFLLVYLCERCDRKRNLIKKIPGPKGWPIIGNILSIVQPPEKLFEYQRSLFKQYGDIYQLHALNVSIVNISNPEDIEMILVKSKFSHKSFPYTFVKPWLGEGLLVSNGNTWLQRRKLLTKAFGYNILKKFTATFVEETNNFLKRLQEEVGERFDYGPLVTETMLRVICETSMGTIKEDVESTIYQYLNYLNIVGDCFAKRLYRVYLHLDFIYKLTGIAKIENAAFAGLNCFTNKVIKNRRNYLAETKCNFFDMDSDNDDKKLAMLDLLLKSEQSGVIDSDGICQEVNTFLFAGHDTTASAMSFMIMAIANEPEIQNKIYEEICQIFGDSDRSPTMEDLNQMKYLDCCIKESLRMYPSVPLIARQVTEDIVLGGHTIPANTIVFIFIYDLHHRPDLYPEPERFIPERFLPENCTKRHPCSYIPFSAGPRNCIGQKYSNLEMKTMISGILRKYRLEPVTKPSDVVYKTDITLSSANPIYARFCKR